MNSIGNPIGNPVDDVRTARVALARLALSGEPGLDRLVAEHGPVAALAQVRGHNRPGQCDIGSQRCHAAREAAHADVRVVIPEDEQWPAALADHPGTPTAHPSGVPLCLWVRGGPALSAAVERMVAAIGSRAATEYGLYVAGQLGHDLAAAGWTVAATSGYGVAAAALRGALAAGGTAVAVLPAGIDRPYPSGNAHLLDQVAAHGLLVSPWPPGTRPTRDRIAATGRLLATLAAGTVLVEAAPRSGALGVLAHAITLGRPAMVVPGPVTSAVSAGAHQALREHRQARLVRDAADVLADLTQAAAE
jgi:DNA processing protein